MGIKRRKVEPFDKKFYQIELPLYTLDVYMNEGAIQSIHKQLRVESPPTIYKTSEEICKVLDAIADCDWTGREYEKGVAKCKVYAVVRYLKEHENNI